MLSVSIIVPVLNEASTIEVTLKYLNTTFAQCGIIVVDGGSSDNTVELAMKYARVIVSQRGRANQMNAGASVSTGDILWFIHADSFVDETALTNIQVAFRKNEIIGGGLTLRFVEDSWSLRLIAKLSNIRARSLHWIFGDQSMFVRRRDFEAVGGFPNISIMEDLEISRQLIGRGKLVVLPAVSRTSARRFLENGTWKTITRMQAMKMQYFLGVHPDVLLRKYSKNSRKVGT